MNRYNLKVDDSHPVYIKVTDKENNIDICLAINRQGITLEQIHDIVNIINETR